MRTEFDKFVGNKFEPPTAGPQGEGQDAWSNPLVTTNLLPRVKLNVSILPGNKQRPLVTVVTIKQAFFCIDRH